MRLIKNTAFSCIAEKPLSGENLKQEVIRCERSSFGGAPRPRVLRRPLAASPSGKKFVIAVAAPTRERCVPNHPCEATKTFWWKTNFLL